MRARRAMVVLTAFATAGLLTPPAAGATTAAVQVDQNVTYTTGDCPGKGVQPEKADVYLPSNPVSKTAPLVVLVHGGSFVAGSKTKEDYPGIAEDLTGLGWVAASIDYCLPPQGTAGFPAEPEDVAAAVAYFDQHASAYGIDPARVALWGGSAGATLVAETATAHGAGEPHTAVAALVGWSGGYDFFDSTGAKPSSLKVVPNYLGCQPTDSSCKTVTTLASASLQVTPGTPPTFLANSTDELVPRNQLDDMQSALEADGVPETSMIIPGNKHATAYRNQAFCPTVAFLTTYLGSIDGSCTPPR